MAPKGLSVAALGCACCCLAAAAALAQSPPAPGKPLAAVPIAAEAAKPDSMGRDDAFRAALLAPGKADWYRVQTPGGILLVVQKGYLAPAQVNALAAELVDADAKLPAWGGRRKTKGRYTVYAYDAALDGKPTPMSEADVPGAQPGEKGVELRWVKEGTAPLFHELAHQLLEGPSLTSQSLSEGLADAAADHFQPGRAHAFVPANADPDALCDCALNRYPAAFYEAIGAPDYSSWSSQTVRQNFYYCSWSFVRWLIGGGAPTRALAVLDANAADAAYVAQFGRPLAALRSAWRAGIKKP